MESYGKYINDFDNQENLIEGNRTLKLLIILIIIILLLFSFKKTKNSNIPKDYINDDYSDIIESVSNEELNKARNSFKQYIYEDTIDSSKTLPYNIFIPEIYSKNKKIPLIIFISDARMVGKDVKAPLYQTIGGPIWATENFQKKHKCFVLVPFYNEIIMDKDEYFKNEYINITIRLMTLIKGKYNIDSKRIYITGQSMGAMASLYLLSNYQNIFAAGLIISGQWKIDELKGLINSTFTYIVSAGDKKAFDGQNEIKKYFDDNNIKYGNINDLNGKINIDKLELYIKNIYALNYKHNFINFAKGTIFSPKNKGRKNEHLASFNYGYKIEAIKDWLFTQKMADYYKTTDGRYILTNFCEKANDDNLCIECIEGYYLSGDKLSCTKEINCENGDNIKGLCQWCKENYYLDMKDRKCKLNLENEEYKYCKIVSYGKCITCDKYYYLDRNNKCSTSQNCFRSKNALCLKCLDGFYLGLDNKCTSIKKCIYSKNNECLECEDGFYYERVNKICKQSKDNFTNCKANNYFKPKKCAICKDNYYLSQFDYLCHDNTKEGPFYKCQISNFKGNLCQFCVENYLIGKLDFKCNKIEGCVLSENENKCLECDDGYCLDNEGNCINNYNIIENDKKFYFRCKNLNEKGNGCKTCENNLSPNKMGNCYDDIHCEKRENGICKKCQKENLRGYYSYCLNKDFGCIDSFLQNCIRCDDNLNLDVCTECEEGFKVDKEGKCIVIR